MKARGKEKEQERARQSDKVTSCPCMVDRVYSVCPSPWQLKHRPDKNATGHGPPSLPSLSSPCTPRPSPFLSIFTLYSPNTHSPSFLPHQPDKKPHNPPSLPLSLSESENAAVPLIHAFLSPSSWGNVTSGASWMISFLLCKQHHVHWGTEAAFKETTSLWAWIQACDCVCVHNGVTNWLFCSNNNISQWFSTPIWLITMPTLAWQPHNFLRLAENHMRHDYALLG